MPKCCFGVYTPYLAIFIGLRLEASFAQEELLAQRLLLKKLGEEKGHLQA
jgi:hypothetical protein